MKIKLTVRFTDFRQSGGGATDYVLMFDGDIGIRSVNPNEPPVEWTVFRTEDGA